MADQLTVFMGPLLRRMTPQRIALTLATSQAVTLGLALKTTTHSLAKFNPVPSHAVRHLQAGSGLHLYFIDLELDNELPTQTLIYYDLKLNQQDWTHWAPDLCYPGHALPFFVFKPQIQHLLHGSCRKPHYPSGDGLVQADDYLAKTAPENWPSLMMLSGDQIYADDVAGPMLYAIHRLINQLGLENEHLPCSEVTCAEDLHQTQPYYYRREALLPGDEASQKMRAKIFSGVKKPIFTTDTAHNHLISLGECIGMYLLVWSPAGWQALGKNFWQTRPATLESKNLATYLHERQHLKSFVEGLSAVRRLMAHLPSAMMFDDHDITDDWNLSAAWEQAAYQHPFSNRIIGNALISYVLFQGWGNAPERFVQGFWSEAQTLLNSPGQAHHDPFIHQLNRYHQWGYQWPTQPPLVVLDTRTQRWRSESKLTKPSGLMDWEALSDLQQTLLGLDAVILVSPAPMFGVKLIEAVQKVFTWLGKPLLVDAENWMAHPGAAHTLINLFRHPKTPKNFVILSGDVHYSFVYRIELRSQKHRSNLWQITSSGIKNEFPKRLLRLLDRLNRWLYAPKSPLNWLTRRRRLRVIPHKPESAKTGERLLNAAGIGLVSLNPDGSPKQVIQLCAENTTHPNQTIGFCLNATTPENTTLD